MKQEIISILKDHGIKILKNFRAIYLEDYDYIVISDLHLGYEIALAETGIYFPKVQLNDICDRILKIKEKTGANGILINGDLKHKFSEHSKEGWKEIIKFFNFLVDNFEKILLINGNHDTFLQKFAKYYKLQVYDFYDEFNEIFLTHGHVYMRFAFDKDIVIIGHEHPALLYIDSTGVKHKFPCFLFQKLENNKILIVMPHFTKLFPGTAINELPKEELLSPYLRKHLTDDAYILLCEDHNDIWLSLKEAKLLLYYQ